MLKKILLPLIFLFFFQFACKQKVSQSFKQPGSDTTEEQTFFPVTEYIRGQLKEMDSLPITPLKITDHNGKVDSVWMKKEAIRSFAEPFLHPVIDTANLKNLFAGKSFLDQTINAFTFSYDPISKLPDTLQLRRWDVYIDPQKNTIKRVYILKESNNNGSLQTIQLTWKANQWCKITTITQGTERQPDKKEETVKWQFDD